MVAQKNARAGTPGWAGVDYGADKALIELDIVFGDVELLHDHFFLSPGQVVDAVCHAQVVVFIDQLHGSIPRLCNACDEVRPGRLSRIYRDIAPDGNDGI